MRCRKWITFLSWVLLSLQALGCASRQVPRAANSTVTLRVMTWNIHHGEGMDGAVDLERVAKVIQMAHPDLVALQEVDRGVSRTGHRDLPHELAALTGMTCLFSNNYHFGGGEYGNAILTRFPVESWTNYHFAMLSPVEQRGLLQARLRTRGRTIVFMNTHLDAQRDDAERLNESTQLLALSKSCFSDAVIVCGDFNATPDHPVTAGMKTLFDDAWELAGQGDGFTIPVATPNRRIDYIWLSRSSEWTVRSIQIITTDASDHLPVVAELELK